MRNFHYLPLLAMLFIGIRTNAQNDCAAYPKTGKFDTLTYIKSSIPTDPNKAPGLYLGQGTILRNGVEVRPAFIPSNHPEWAIAIAVAWNYSRNIVNRVEYPQIGYWLATVVQETELGCVAGTTWDAAYKASNNMANANTIMNHDGCFQIEGPGSAYGQLNQNYPMGRFPAALHPQLIMGPTNFETSAMVKSYFDVYTTSVYNNHVGWNVYESIDCTTDPYAYIKTSASGYNGGINAFAGNAGKFNGSQNNNACWGNFTATTANYANDVAKWVSVLENTPSYCEYPTGSSFDSYYNGDMTWTMVNNYINSIKIMYPEVNWTTATAAVQAKFNSLAVGGKIQFQQMGDVIDAIVLNLPKDYPQTVEGSPIGVDIYGCSGKKVPYGHFEILNGAQTVCIGESVTLNIVVDAGGGAAPTFKWYKVSSPGTILATTQSYTITPTVAGSEIYGAEICNGTACYKLNNQECNACMDNRNLCGIKINAKQCSNCTFTATASSTNTPCKGIPEGKINLTLNNAPANYTVKFSGTTSTGKVNGSFSTSGNAVQIDKLRDGSYNIELVSATDPNCIARTTVIVGYNTNMNYYLDANVTGTANCVANVKAEVKELPAPCNWKVRVHVPVFFMWENPVNFGVITNTGLTNVDRYTRTAPKPEIDQWNDAQIYESVFSLNTGDEMTFKFGLTATPGATMFRAYQINVFDENNTLVKTIDVPAGSATETKQFVAGSYKVTCPATIPNYTFSWSPSLSTVSNTNKTSTGTVPVDKTADKTYTVTAINNAAPQCSLKDTVFVLKNPACNTVTCVKPSATISGGGAICAGDSTLITVTLTGTQPWKVKYSNGATKYLKTGITASPFTFYAKNAGTYKVDSVWDANCDTLGKASAVVTQSTSPTLTISGDTTICTGETAQINLALTGTAPFNIVATVGAVNIPFTTSLTSYIVPLSTAGTYSIKVTDASGCSVTKKVTIIINTLPTLELGADKAICSGASVTLDAGATFSTYAWTGAKTGAAKTILADVAGEYKLLVTDANGCKARDSLQVTQGAAVVINFGSATKTMCAGSTAGIKPNVSGGDGNFTYLWSNKGTGTLDSVVANAIGYYTLEVTDGKGCKDKDSVQVQFSTSPTVAITGDTTICTGETAQINLALTGTAPFNIVATIGAVNIPFTTSLTSYVVPLSTAGTYSLKVTDATGCSVTKKVTIIINTLPTLELGADKAICSGASVTLDAGATFSTYSWTGAKTGAAKTILADVAGQFKLEVTDANGCKTRDSLNVSQGAAVVIDFGGTTKTICAGTSVTLKPNVTGGDGNFSYKWSNSAYGTLDSVVANAAGYFTLEVTDGKGCKDKDSAQVTVSSSLTVTLANKTICSGDSIVVNSGYSGAGYTFLWNTGATSPTISVKNAGNYSVDVANNGCTGSGSMTLALNTLPNVNLGSDKNVCAGTTTLLDAGSFATYAWSTLESSQTITKGAGTYSVIVTDANGCKDSDTIVVNSITKPTPNVLADAQTCKNTNVTFDVSSFTNANGPFTYKWDDNSTAATLLLSNVQNNSTHWVDVTDKYGCTGRDSANVVVKNGLSVQITGTPDTTMCAGQSITLSSSLKTANGYNISWSTGATTDDIIVSTGGNITLNVNDGNGCNGSDVMNVKVNTAPDMSLIPTTASICSGDAAMIGYDYGAGYTYQWTPANNSAIIGTAVGGTFNVIVTNPKGCSADTDIVVTSHPKPTVEIGDNVSACTGQTLTLQESTGQTGVTYQWTKKSSGNTVIGTNASLQITTNDDYNLKVVDAFGCYNNDVITATFNTTPSVNLASGKDSLFLCGTETLVIDAGNAAPGITYSWSPTNATTQTQMVGGTSATYRVIVKNGTCSDTDQVYVKTTVLPKGVLSDTLYANKSNYCFVEEKLGIQISAVGADGKQYHYLWSTGETTPTIIVKQEGKYLVNVYEDQCQEGDNITLIDYCPTTFYIPEAFTPNGDNKNEFFKVYGTNIPNFEIYIFNRWGEVVYHSTDYTQSWNGTYMGNLVQEDVYVVKVMYGVNQENGTVKRQERLQKLTVIH